MKIERKSEGKHAVVLALSGNIQGGPDSDLFTTTLSPISRSISWSPLWTTSIGRACVRRYISLITRPSLSIRARFVLTEPMSIPR